jgi:hypothetical protein
MMELTNTQLKFEKIPNENFEVSLVIPHGVVVGIINCENVEKLENNTELWGKTSYWGGTTLKFVVSKEIEKKIIALIRKEIEDCGLVLSYSGKRE